MVAGTTVRHWQCLYERAVSHLARVSCRLYLCDMISPCLPVCLPVASAAVTPPGHKTTGGDTTKCGTGYYRADWAPSAADCTPCSGDAQSGIESEDNVDFTVYKTDAADNTETVDSTISAPGNDFACCKC